MRRMRALTSEINKIIFNNRQGNKIAIVLINIIDFGFEMLVLPLGDSPLN
jgi:hypothetical protein